MPRVLVLATTTGYQTRAFGEAAERLGTELVFATDRCHTLEDPWQDAAVSIRFHDEASSMQAVLESARKSPVDGVIAVGDRPTVIAALVSESLGLPGHPPSAAAVSRDKRLTRERLRQAGMLVPWFQAVPASAEPVALLGSVLFPCVLKPAALSGSRGVIRADSEAEFVAAFSRIRSLLLAPEIRNERNEAHDLVLIEGFIEGTEYALEGMMNDGALHTLAIFDKPDPLDGPFFEETIYLTPSAAPAGRQAAVIGAVSAAAQAIGLRHGPIHAECRVNSNGVFVLEVAARPIGGLCARALRFVPAGMDDRRSSVPLEELLLRHALGANSTGWTRESTASGVMMIPIPFRGVLRQVSGDDEARQIPYIEGVQITAKPDQVLVPSPEGASYLGFIFARAESAGQVDAALRVAHARLKFAILPEVRVLQSQHG